MTDFQCKSVTLPKDLAEFAEEKIKRLSKQTGEPANLSKYIRDLIRADKDSENAPIRKKAA